jgi:YVTN family beta-propeller protein
MSVGPELPSGTVTFLFTDIEGSTRLLKQLRDRYVEVLAEHQRLLREVFAEHGGREIDTQGDSFFIAFRRAKDAVGAAIAAQHALSAHGWPDAAALRVRMGIHTGEPVVGSERYVGMGVHRAARISAAGHGGQVLVSQTTRELLRDDPLPDVTLRDLGEHQLKDLDEPERIYQLVAPGLGEEFPALKSAAPAPFEGREAELAEAAQEAVEEMVRGWRRLDRRLLVGGVSAVLVLGAVLGVLLTRGGAPGANASGEVAANAVGVVDPGSGKVISQIPVGVAPSGVASGSDAIWVANANDNTISRIDPKTNDVRQTVSVGADPVGIAVGKGAVWVANGLDSTVSRIDPATNQVVQTTLVGNGPGGIAYGEHAVWVTNSTDGTVSRIDPDTGGVTGTLPAAVGATGVAVGFGHVWVVSPPSASLVVLDPHSGQVTDRIGVGVDPAAVAAGAGAIWVANRSDGTVSKIDPRALAVTDTVQVGRLPASVAAAPSGVWVANGGDGTLSKIDPMRGGVVKTVRLANPPQGLAFAPNGVYVAVRSSGREHRGGTLRVVDTAPDFIDPTLAYSAQGWAILSMTNDGLVGFRRVGGIEGVQLVPDLAVSIPTPTVDGKTYTFRLRPGVRYSNGRLVQPEDFRSEIERIFEITKPVSPGRQYYGGIAGTGRCKPGRRCDLARSIVTDRLARTISFHLTASDADFLMKLALPFTVAVPANIPARDIGTQPVPATGPYRIAAYRKNHSVRLVRNPRFREWSVDAQPDGYPDTITWQFSSGTNPSAQVQAVQRGKADVALNLVPPLSKEQLDALATRYPSQLHMGTAFATNYFFLNTRVPPFDDVRVRRAVNYAFDRQAFVRLLGRAFASTCQLLPPNSASYRRSCPYGSGGIASLDKARRLVRRSGTIGASVIVWVPEPIAVQGRFMVSVLESLGYRAHLKAVHLATGISPYFNKILDSRTRAQTGYYGWIADFPSVGGFLQPQFSCAAFVPGKPDETADPSGFCDPSIDRLLARAAAVQAQNPPAASILWKKVEQAILAQAPMVPTYNRQNVDFVAKRVGNHQLHPQWGVLLDQLWLK